MSCKNWGRNVQFAERKSATTCVSISFTMKMATYIIKRDVFIWKMTNKIAYWYNRFCVMDKFPRCIDMMWFVCNVNLLCQCWDNTCLKGDGNEKSGVNHLSKFENGFSIVTCEIVFVQPLATSSKFSHKSLEAEMPNICLWQSLTKDQYYNKMHKPTGILVFSIQLNFSPISQVWLN